MEIEANRLDNRVCPQIAFAYFLYVLTNYYLCYKMSVRNAEVILKVAKADG